MDANVMVAGKSYVIRQLRPDQLAYAEQNQREAGLYLAAPVYNQYYKPYVLDAGVVGAPGIGNPRLDSPRPDSAEAAALFEKIIDLSLGLNSVA